jgi:DNA-binding PadR family transcriptional regulator
MTEHHRRARYYRITAAGRERLTADTTEFDRMVEAIRRIRQTG